jgi:hypothetical protein
LYDSLVGAISKHKAATEALLLEAARAADRLALMDDAVVGKGVLDLLRFRLEDEEGRVATVKFDGVLSEARQQQANLAALMKVIIPNLDPEAGAAKGRDVLDEIAQRRAARRTGPAKGAGRSKRSS